MTVEATTGAVDASATSSEANANVSTGGASPAAEIAGVGSNFTGIPETFAKDPAFEGFKSVDDVFSEFKTLKEVQANRDNNGLVAMIGEGSSPEQINDFYTKLGKPASPAEYDLTAPEGLPEGLNYSDERTAKFAEFAHSQNFTKAQTQAAFTWYNDLMSSEYSAYQEAQAGALDNNIVQLEKAWGGDIDSAAFKLNHQNALRAFNHVADTQLAEAFNSDKALATNPLVLQVLAKLGAKMDPDSVPSVSGQEPTGRFTNSIDAVDKAIADFHSSGKFKEMLGTGANAKALKAEWQGLYDKRAKLANENAG